jgi:thiosulfate/3-mercaptopyruvate sulfurtransferase
MDLRVANMTNDAGYTHPEALVDPVWLRDHRDDPGIRVVEVDVSRARYDDGHIPGAVLWNVYADLKDPRYRPVDGRAFRRLVETSGITPDSTVVFYGYAPAMGVWLMKLHGHGDARILNCSREAWAARGYGWAAAPTERARSTYRLRAADAALRATVGRVRRAAADRTTTIVDVRTEPEYRGEQFWPSGGNEPGGRAGRVPTAVHLPITELYDERGSFLPADDLRAVFDHVDLGGNDDVITYCTVGGRACTAWFVLNQLLGREHVKVYDGSWAEWGLVADAPVATG